jgi:acyl-CoA synthetase (AMP-forming)/AMP-acid ligase II
MREQAYDVGTLHGRRATDRVNRLAVGDILERVTWSFPDKPALVGCPGSYGSGRFAQMTYREADQAANQVAHALLQADLPRSARVALLCDNSVEAVIAMFGIAKAGLVCVPLNPLFHASVTEQLLAQVDASFAIVDADLWPQAAPAFAAAGLEPRVTITAGGGDLVRGTVAFADWIDGQPADEPELEIALHGDDIWLMLFTSGTTSAPKAVMYSHTYSYIASLAFKGTVTRGLRFEEDLRLCTFLPIVYHCGHNAAVFPAFLAGGTCILGRRFDPPAVAEAVAAQKATALWGGAPRFLDLTASAAEQHPGLDFSTLTVGLFAWSAMTAELAARLHKLAGPDLLLVEAFGQTEAISCYRFWLEQFPEKVESSAGTVNHVGVPNPLLGAAILDAGGRPISQPGVPGEAAYRSPAVMTGYYRDQDATKTAFRGGWFHSGDSCAYESDGSQTMVDRYKDIIKTGGENVASIRVETVAASHPAIDRAAAIGLPDERWGERVTIVATRAGDAAVTAEELLAYCRERLAGFESPKEAIFVSAFPETVGGKILKYKLRQQLSAAEPPPATQPGA